MAQQALPDDERIAVVRHLAQIDQMSSPSRRWTVTCPTSHQGSCIQRLMSLPGVDVTVGSGVAAAIGDISRFPEPQKLVGYLGSIRA